MNKNFKWKLLIVIVVVCICLYFIITKSLNRGLDIAGGTHFTIEVVTDGLSEDKKKDAIDKTLLVFRNRIDEIGIAGTTVQRAENNRIIVQVPGIGTEEANRIKGILTRMAHLEFKIVIDGPGEPITVDPNI
jgi:preprotein translocase subunit SecD